MEFKVTGHNHCDMESTYYVELDRVRTPWITEEDVKQLITRPEFVEFLRTNDLSFSTSKPPFMENPLVAVTDKNGRNVFSVDYFGTKITHQRDYRVKADKITRWLVGHSLIEADERYIAINLKSAGLTLPKYVQ